MFKAETSKVVFTILIARMLDSSMNRALADRCGACFKRFHCRLSYAVRATKKLDLLEAVPKIHYEGILHNLSHVYNDVTCSEYLWGAFGAQLQNERVSFHS